MGKLTTSEENHKGEIYRVSDFIIEQGGIDNLFESNKSNLISIISGTGSGKSYFIKYVLSKSGRILFVTSRAAKVLQDKDEVHHNTSFSTEFNGAVLNTVCTNWALSNQIITCCSNKSKSDSLKAIKKFANDYDYIVFDEFHSLVCDSLFNDEIFNVAVFFCYCVFELKKKTIILTATEQPVKFFINAVKTQLIERGLPTDNNFFDLTKYCKYILPNTIRIIAQNKTKNKQIDNLLSSGKNIIYFMNHVGDKSSEENDKGYTIFQEYEYLINNGLKKEEIAVIVSKNLQQNWDKKHGCEKTRLSSIIKDKNGDYIKISYNEWVREQISLNNEIPDGIRVILCSATLNEGISIDNMKENPFSYIITDAHYISTLIQQMGRLRNNIKELWVIGDAKQHININDEIQRELLLSNLDFKNSLLSYLSDEEIPNEDILSKLKFKNSFLNYLTEYAEGIKDYKKRYEFIHWICKEKGFDLLAYSYITHRFQFNDLRYKMRKEINKINEIYNDPHLGKISIWEKELYEFTKKYNINFKCSRIDKILTKVMEHVKIRKHIETVVNKDFYGNEWNREKMVLKELGLGTTEKTINNTLRSLGLPYDFKKSEKKKHGKNTYRFLPFSSNV